MYENLTAYLFLDGASDGAVQSIMLGGIEELDANRIGVCYEVLADRGNLQAILQVIYESGPIYLPSAAAISLSHCLMRPFNLGSTARLLGMALKAAIDRADDREVLDFDFVKDFLNPLEYLTRQSVYAYSEEEFVKIYDDAKKDGVGGIPTLNADGKAVAYALMRNESYSNGIPQSFKTAYAQAKMIDRCSRERKQSSDEQ